MCLCVDMQEARSQEVAVYVYVLKITKIIDVLKVWNISISYYMVLIIVIWRCICI